MANIVWLDSTESNRNKYLKEEYSSGDWFTLESMDNLDNVDLVIVHEGDSGILQNKEEIKNGTLEAKTIFKDGNAKKLLNRLSAFYMAIEKCRDELKIVIYSGGTWNGARKNALTHRINEFWNTKMSQFYITEVILGRESSNAELSVAMQQIVEEYIKNNKSYVDPRSSISEKMSVMELLLNTIKIMHEEGRGDMSKLVPLFRRLKESIKEEEAEQLLSGDEYVTEWNVLIKQEIDDKLLSEMLKRWK